uniref:Carboxypeptidase B-like n=1 Tax=Hirondellea gigas TaxID=1518452 RepID=A0A6A7FVD5_9CRUS
MKVLASAALLLLLVAAVATAEKVSYDGYKVLRLSRGAENVEMSWARAAIGALDLDIWSDSHHGIDVLVGPEHLQEFRTQLRAQGVPATVYIDDVQGLMDEEMKKIRERPQSKTGEIDHTTYRDFEQLQREIDDLERNYPDLVSSNVVGTTVEGRDLRVVTVSSNGGNTLPTVWIDCGMHAREWVSQATCMYILDTLTSQYGSDEGITSLLDSYDFQILPVANPDGYSYSWTDDRLWRKNRVQSGICYGVDPNRNFDNHFGGPGTSTNPCSQIFCGPAAFSEAESKAVRDPTTALGDRLAGFFTIHSYSQYWMTPYGFEYVYPVDFDEMMRVSEIGVDALTAMYGTKFVYGSIADVIYLASGGSTDWAYDSTGVTYPFAIELRDQGRYGFVLPEDQILPTAQEAFAGIVAAVNAFQ